MDTFPRLIARAEVNPALRQGFAFGKTLVRRTRGAVQKDRLTADRNSLLPPPCPNPRKTFSTRRYKAQVFYLCFFMDTFLCLIARAEVNPALR